MQRLCPQKSVKNCFGPWTVFMRWSSVWLCTRDGRLKAGPLRDQCHRAELFLSLDLWCEDLVPPPQKKCFGHWTVFMRWSDVWLWTRDGWLKADSLRSWFYPTRLFLSLGLWCKDLVPRKRGKTDSDTGLSLCADQMFDFVQEMGDLKLAL